MWEPPEHRRTVVLPRNYLSKQADPMWRSHEARKTAADYVGGAGFSGGRWE